MSAKEKFWLSSLVQDPLGKTSWTLGSKSPIHTEYLGLLTHSPYMQAAQPSNQPTATSHCPSLGDQLILSLEGQPVYFILFYFILFFRQDAPTPDLVMSTSSPSSALLFPFSASASVLCASPIPRFSFLPHPPLPTRRGLSPLGASFRRLQELFP